MPQRPILREGNDGAAAQESQVCLGRWRIRPAHEETLQLVNSDAFNRCQIVNWRNVHCLEISATSSNSTAYVGMDVRIRNNKLTKSDAWAPVVRVILILK